MSARSYLGEINYPCEDTLSLAGTAQIVGSGNTFASPVSFILITYASLASFIAKASAALGSAGDGTADGRIYIPEGGSNILLPWTGQDVFFVNAVAAELPAIYVVGIS